MCVWPACKQVFDDITSGRTLCDANGHLRLAGFKAMAHSLLAAHGAGVSSSAAKQSFSVKAAAKAAVNTLKRWLRVGHGGSSLPAADKGDAVEVLHCVLLACASAF